MPDPTDLNIQLANDLVSKAFALMPSKAPRADKLLPVDRRLVQPQEMIIPVPIAVPIVESAPTQKIYL